MGPLDYADSKNDYTDFPYFQYISYLRNLFIIYGDRDFLAFSETSRILSYVGGLFKWNEENGMKREVEPPPAEPVPARRSACLRRSGSAQAGVMARRRGSSTCFVGRNPPKHTPLRSYELRRVPSTHSSTALNKGRGFLRRRVRNNRDVKKRGGGGKPLFSVRDFPPYSLLNEGGPRPGRGPRTVESRGR